MSTHAPWTDEQVLAVAPDDGSVAAARKLAVPRPWTRPATNGIALWGECKGSGKAPYRTAVDLLGPAFKCNCPSRKFPCKHALALLLLWAGQPGSIATEEPPEWVAEWIDARRERVQEVEAKATGAGAADGEPRDDDGAGERRREATRTQREERVAAGIEDLRRWLSDVIRGGLAAAQQRPYEFWDTAAARMVDAQAPGLASRIRSLGEIAAAGREGWPERLLDGLSLLYLLCEAYDRLETLPPDLQAEVRSLVGFNTAREAVLTSGEQLRDQWVVLGQTIEDQERLLARRTWLWGRACQAPALLLDFAAGGRPFAEMAPPPGTELDATLAFYPGSPRLRALVAVQHGPPAQTAEPAGFEDFGAALDAHSRAVAASPWLERFPLALARAAIVPDHGRFSVRTPDADVPLAGHPDSLWRAAAVSGGEPIGVFGEFRRGELRPLSVHANGRLVAL